MTNMAAMPIYGKNLKIFFSGAKRPMTLKVGARVPPIVFSNDDSGLILTYFIARSNLVSYGFVWEKGKTMDFFQKLL